MSKGPVLIDLESEAPARPEAAPPVPETLAPEGRAMMAAITVAGKPPSRLSRWFWATATGLFATILGIAAWDYAVSLVARWPILGWTVTALFATLLVFAALLSLREIAAVFRLARIDRVQAGVRGATDLKSARAATVAVRALTTGRRDLDWGRARFDERAGEVMDADALLALAERELVAPLDQRAAREVEAAARQVATVTALIPLPLADVLTALTANLRMIRRIAEIYGGRSGVLGSWRLTRAVMAHLVATGAVAMGDDMLGSFLGGGVLAKLSRRFGEGVVNGALTARVGLAAMEVCRPMPFTAGTRPSVSGTVKRALTGLFGRE